MEKTISWYFVLMALSPILAFFMRQTVDVEFYWFFLSIGTLLSVVYFFVTTKKIQLYQFMIPGLFFLIELIIWDVQWKKVEYEGLFMYLYKNLHLHTLAILFLVYNFTLKKEFYQAIVNIFKITLIVGAAFTLIQFTVDQFFFTPDDIIKQQMRSQEFRLNSCFGFLSSGDIGLSFIPVLAIVVSHSLRSNERMTFIWLLLGLLITFLNKSRYILVNFMIISFLLVTYRKLTLQRFIGFISILIVLLIGLLVLLKFDLREYTQSRLFSDTSTRFLAWDIFQKVFPGKVFFGSGNDLTDEVLNLLKGRSSQLHVGYLASLYTFGVVGSLFLFSYWVSLTTDMFRTGKKSGFYAGYYAMLTFLVANLTLVSFTIHYYGLILSLLLTRSMVDITKQVKGKPYEVTAE